MTSWQQRTEQLFGPDKMERLLPATHATIGRLKTDVMQERLLVINPALTLHTLPVYLTSAPSKMLRIQFVHSTAISACKAIYSSFFILHSSFV